MISFWPHKLPALIPEMNSSFSFKDDISLEDKISISIFHFED